MRQFEDLVHSLHSHPFFDEFVKHIKSAYPVVPSHDPKNDNTEIWKAKSAEQRGFEICLSFFKIKV